MKVNSWTKGGGCGGGNTTVKIMIKDRSSVCHTKAIQYPTGETVVWKSDNQLQDCAEKKFSPNKSKIYYTIKPTDNDRRYCIDELVVIFDDQQSTKYMALPESEWRKGDLTFGLNKSCTLKNCECPKFWEGPTCTTAQTKFGK